MPKAGGTYWLLTKENILIAENWVLCWKLDWKLGVLVWRSIVLSLNSLSAACLIVCFVTKSVDGSLKLLQHGPLFIKTSADLFYKVNNPMQTLVSAFNWLRRCKFEYHNLLVTNEQWLQIYCVTRAPLHRSWVSLSFKARLWVCQWSPLFSIFTKACM